MAVLGFGMAQRDNRKGIRRKRRKKSGRSPVFRLFSVVLILVVMIAGISVFFKLALIEVSGTQKYAPEDIIGASEVLIGENLFFINKFSVANKIFAGLPYVDEVKISRNLPDTLIIEIKESAPAAAIENDSNFWLIDKNVKILEKTDSETAGEYAKIIGVTLLAPAAGDHISVAENESDKKGFILELLNAMSDKGIIEDVDEIDLEELSDISFALSGRFDVELGRTENIGYKLDYMLKIIDKLEPNDKGTIDLKNEQVAYFIPE